jgi:hypothetical protein
MEPEMTTCAKAECVCKRVPDTNYCKKHQLQVFVDEVVSEGKKTCAAYIRGCRVKLELTYAFAKCETCRTKEREREHNRRRVAKEEALLDMTANERLCNTCCSAQPIDQFIGALGVETVTCQSCRDAGKVQESKRDKEHRNALAREAAKNEERIAVKKQWKENNYEKVAKYRLTGRQNQIEKNGVEEYLKTNAERMKKWREDNPEKVEQNNRAKINSIKLQYGVYQRSAGLKQLPFEMTQDEFERVVKNPCKYCGIIQDKGFNGIDRIDSGVGYVIENSVSCCSMCNYMKNTVSASVFVRRAEHILTYNGLIDGRLYSELFGDHKGVSYNDYKYRATKKKNLDFTTTSEEFDAIRMYDCYLCGKENTTIHRNGVDRFDNLIGYTPDNCRSCCADCNYMKRNYSYDDMLEKMKLIYEHNQNMVFDENDIANITPMMPSNKKSAEQIKTERETIKKQRRLDLEARYKDDNYKKVWAKQIADNRKNGV